MSGGKMAGWCMGATVPPPLVLPTPPDLVLSTLHHTMDTTAALHHHHCHPIADTRDQDSQFTWHQFLQVNTQDDTQVIRDQDLQRTRNKNSDLPTLHNSSSQIPELRVRPGDLAYLAEGADHMVVRFLGQGQVLRLRKTVVGKETSQAALVERARKDGEFFRSVARPFLGHILTDKSSLVIVHPNALTTFKQSVESRRPERRRKKEINRYGVAWICPDAASTFSKRTSEIPSNSNTPAVPSLNSASHWTPAITSATSSLPSSHPSLLGCQVLSNLRTVPSSLSDSSQFFHGAIRMRKEFTGAPKFICVEIKPKQGFIDQSTPSHPMCCFCINQYVKPEKCHDRSRYCPQDLFSGDLRRMRKAVRSLFETPQTNLKVFEEGESVEDIKVYSYLCDVIIAALIHDYTSNITQLPSTDVKGLSPESPLGKTLAFQKLDKLGVLKANALYRQLVERMGSSEAADTVIHDLTGWKRTFCKDFATEIITLDNKKDSLYPHDDSVLNNINKQSDLCELKNFMVPSMENCSHIVSSQEQMVQGLQNFLLATTAKDLSLMILLHGPHYSSCYAEPGSHVSPFIIELEKSIYYKCQVTAVDLIAKPPHKIRKREQGYKKQLDLLQTLLSNGEEPSCCKS